MGSPRIDPSTACPSPYRINKAKKVQDLVEAPATDINFESEIVAEMNSEDPETRRLVISKFVVLTQYFRLPLYQILAVTFQSLPTAALLLCLAIEVMAFAASIKIGK